MTNEHDRALMEGARNSACDDYFAARPQIDTMDRRRVYEAGFQAGATSRDDEVATLRELKQLYQTGRDQLREQVALLRSHMTTFVRRCDLGEIRSNKTYASFVKALADTEPKK